jgi:glycosyltransferase involved in cell wall biosynthesis
MNSGVGDNQQTDDTDLDISGLPERITISVIIPTHDRPSSLKRAVASVTSQTTAAHEIIVVDNGKTEAQVAGVPDGIRVLRAPASIGASQARNIGAAVASGTYLAFLDDDDTWTVDYLCEIVRALNSAPEAPLCAVGALYDAQTRAPVGGKNGPLPTTTRTWVRRNPGFGGSNIVVERALFLEIGGFDGALSANEDIDLALRLIAADAVINRIGGAVALYDSGHGGPRLTGWWNLTTTKYRLARKHLRGPLLPLLVCADYGGRLLISATFPARTGPPRRRNRARSAEPHTR